MADVTVRYAFSTAGGAVNVEILVEKDGSSNVVGMPALPSLPKGLYQVTWQMVAGQGVRNPTFDLGDGISVTTQPPNVQVSNSARRQGDPSFWDATITNSVIGANTLVYRVKGQCLVDNNTVPFTESTFIVDPTVAVTPDPPPGG